MHLGAYGQAYFAAETTEVVSGEPLGECLPRCPLPSQQLAHAVPLRRLPTLFDRRPQPLAPPPTLSSP
jgi:hypothetical protein